MKNVMCYKKVDAEKLVTKEYNSMLKITKAAQRILKPSQKNETSLEFPRRKQTKIRTKEMDHRGKTMAVKQMLPRTPGAKQRRVSPKPREGLQMLFAIAATTTTTKTTSAIAATIIKTTTIAIILADRNKPPI